MAIFLASTAFADSSSDALGAARTAFYIQSGLQATTAKIGAHIEYRAHIYTDRLGITNHLATGMFIYKVYKDKSISFPYKKYRFSLGIGDYNNPSPSITCSFPWSLK